MFPQAAIRQKLLDEIKGLKLQNAELRVANTAVVLANEKLLNQIQELKKAIAILNRSTNE